MIAPSLKEKKRGTMNTQKIELSEIKPEKYLDLINAIVLILDIDGNVIHINKKGVSVLGYDVPEKIVGRNWFDDFIEYFLKWL